MGTDTAPNNDNKQNTLQTSSSKIVILALAVFALLGLGWMQFNAEVSNGGAAISSGGGQDDAAGVPSFLTRSFPDSDFSNASAALSGVLSGGPGKDGIPAISNPKFVPISETSARDEVQTIVIEKADGQRRAYPYSILNWHEIVNDEVDGTPIAITFCPLCGSAVVYNRNTPEGVSEFGVSGALIESNMVMFDRLTDSLWQQSTGETLAGQQHEATLEIEPFQLLTVGDLKDRYPDAEIMSDDTGAIRDYDRNPYSGYDEDEQFIFSPSFEDKTFPVKEVFAVVSHEDKSVALQWLELENGRDYTVENSDGTPLTVNKTAGELTVVTAAGEELPFYFEMWFSWAVQHQDDDGRTVFSPES